MEKTMTLNLRVNPTIKKQAERAGLIKTNLVPGYIGYTSMENARLFRAYKQQPLTSDQELVARIIANRQPVTKRTLLDVSRLSPDDTAEALNALVRMSYVYQDYKSNYCLMPGEPASREGALKRILLMHFNDFGIFSALIIFKSVASR